MRIKFSRQVKILLTAIVVVAGLFVYQQTKSTQTHTGPTNDTQSSQQLKQPTKVSTIRATTSPDAIQASGQVTAQQKAAVAAEVSGVVDTVMVDVGDRVSAGQTIAQFSNTSQQANVRQAQANLQSQQARLEELRSGPRPQERANARVSLRQAQESVEQARYDLFNTDLQAYVSEGESAVRSGSLTPPTISGSYEGDESGRYVIRLYKSGAKSGYSFRYSGLEEGAGTVSTDTPQPLGTRGLYIEFPDNFATNQLLRWEVPIPNKRSPRYQQAKNNLTQARNQLEEARNNLSLAASGTRSEQIDQQEAQVAASEAGLESAEIQLADAEITAPFSGIVQSTLVSAGDYRGAGQPIVELVNTNSLEVEATMSLQEANRVAVGDRAFIKNNSPAVVTSKSPAVSDTGNIFVTLQIIQPQQANVTPGEFVSITFLERNVSNSPEGRSNLLYVPLSVVETRSSNSFIYVVTDNGTAQQIPVDTNSVTGQRVEISGNLPDRPIIRNASMVSEGDSVEITTDGRE